MARQAAGFLPPGIYLVITISVYIATYLAADKTSNIDEPLTDSSLMMLSDLSH